MKDVLPDLDGNVNRSAHVVILGAGASFAAFPHGEGNGLKLPLMNNLIETVGLADLLETKGIATKGIDFEALYYNLSTSGQHPDLIKELENRIYNYFSKMQLPESPTIYDYLILSLREKDVIATFNWDPFLAQAFRRNMHVVKPPQMAYLHGNVEIGICREDKTLGYNGDQCHKCGNPFSPSRLLYPVKQKDYDSDPSIKSEWARLSYFLRGAYFLTIYGYSAPKTDVEARKMMLTVWKDNPLRSFAQIEMVDVKPCDEMEKSWDEYIVREHYNMSNNIFGSYLFSHPRRSCEALAAATLMCAPWDYNPYPHSKIKTLNELHNWLTPLIDEEEQYRRNGEQFSGKPCMK